MNQAASLIFCLVAAVVLGSPASPATAQDAFENDNTPLRARPYDGQPRSFHLPDDRDWVFLDGTGGDFLGYQFSVLSNDGASGFHPLVEVFSSQRLTDPQVAPLTLIGNCAGPAGDITGEFSHGPSLTLIRISQCQDTGGEAGYDTSLVLVSEIGGVGGAEIVGTVTGPGGGAAGVFILTTENVTTVSSPANGSYRLITLADTETTLQVVSERFTVHPVPVPPIPEFTTEVIDIVVQFADLVFAGGFE